MSLTLYSHPLSSFCQKVLIALYENDTPFEARAVDFADADQQAALRAHWPVGKIPVLHDAASGRWLAETSIIIEYLAQEHPGPARLLPGEPGQQLEVRLWDRFFDLYVNAQMQKIVTDRIRPEGQGDPFGVEQARGLLATAYGMIENQLAERPWAAGERFTMADCAAAPGLFYASIIQPFDDRQANLAAYFERLVARPSVARALREARPVFALFPYRELIPRRFLED